MIKITFDTSFIVGMKFHFSAIVFERLAILVKIGAVKVYLVDIIDEEIKAKITCSSIKIAQEVSNSLTSNRLFEQINFDGSSFFVIFFSMIFSVSNLKN
ncbi:hypothetical protein [Maridesulfovibrio sp. FT414]|uniref:hypothetical protein n=1 Tax=Maridesulfovibrio sp. FT414 TaxID=2979469 RepID=UPI003D803622